MLVVTYKARFTLSNDAWSEALFSSVFYEEGPIFIEKSDVSVMPTPTGEPRAWPSTSYNDKA